MAEVVDLNTTQAKMQLPKFETIAQAHLFTASTFHLQTSGDLG